MQVAVAVLVLLVVLVLSLGVLALAVFEHARTRTHLIVRALVPTYVNTLLVAIVVAIPSAGSMVTLASEDAGEALLFMAALGGLLGGASGLVFTPIIIIGVGLVLRWRWRRAEGDAAPVPDGPHPISLSLAGCAAALGIVASVSAVSLWMLDPDEWMYILLPFVLPGGLAALGALAGRRWLGGAAALGLNLLPVLGLIAAFLVDRVT